MAEDARRRITEWLEAAPSALDLVSQLLDEHQRLRDATEVAERECARLRQELAALRAENERLVKEWSEIDDLIASALGKASDALLRFRASLAAPTADSAPSPVTLAPPAAASVSAPAVLAPAEGPATVPTAASPPGTPMGPSPRRILLVDDDANVRSMITDYLSDNRGYEVLAAASGEEALTLLPRFQPQAVLLDLAMPGGGMWAIERIKTLHPDLCVIMVTANDDVNVAQKARTLGAADYVTKPFDLDHLDAVLNSHMTRGDATPAPRCPVPPAMVAVDGRAALLTAVRPIRSCFARR